MFVAGCAEEEYDEAHIYCVWFNCNIVMHSAVTWKLKIKLYAFALACFLNTKFEVTLHLGSQFRLAWTLVTPLLPIF